MIYIVPRLLMLLLFVGWVFFHHRPGFKFNRRANPKANYHGVQKPCVEQ